MAYPTTACGESRLIWKGRVTPGTPDELPDFWESAVEMCRITKSKLPTAEESPSVTGDNEERKADQAENTRCQSALLHF